MKKKINLKNKIPILLILIFFLTLSFSSLLINATRGDERRVTYHINHSSLTTTYVDDYLEGDTTYIKFPANIEFDPASGYHFVKWNTQADGSGTDYDLASAVSLTSDLDLYAIWDNSADPITAILYDDSSYNASNATTLTTGGAVASDWDYSAVRYLKINLSGNAFANGQVSTLSVTLPTGMYIYNNNYTTSDGNIITNVAFTKYTGGTGDGMQGTGTYSNDLTGTLTYTFSANATSSEIIIPVMYDVNLWDGVGHNGNLTGNNFLIRVTLDNTYTKYLSYAEASKGYGVDNDNAWILYWPTDNNFLLDSSDSLKFTGFAIMNYNITNKTLYFKNLKLEITIPYKSTDSTVMAVFDSTKLNGALINFPNNYTMDTTDPTKIVITFNDIYLSSQSYIFSPYYYFNSSDGWSDGDTIISSVSITATSYNDSVYILSKSNSLTHVVAQNEELYLKVNGNTLNYDSDLPNGYVNYLGCCSIQNKGLSASVKKRITFNFDTTTTTTNTRNMLDVSAIRVPTLTKNTAGNETQDIDFILVDEYNNEVLGSAVLKRETNSNNKGIYITSSGLVSVYNGNTFSNIQSVTFPSGIDTTKTYYFKQIKYEIESIPASTELSNSQAQASYSSGGTFWGELVSNNAKVNCTIESWNSNTSSYIIEKTDSVTIKFGTTNRTSTYISKLYIGSDNSSSETIVAGDRTSMKIRAQAIPYPYTYSNFSNKPIFYILLPDGIEILNNSSTIYISSLSGNRTITNVNIVKSSNLTADGKRIWTITFPNEDAGFGGWRLSNSGINANDYLELNLQISTSNIMNYTVLNLTSNIYLGDELADEVYSGSFSVNRSIDTLDLDGDGSTTDILSTYDKNKLVELTIIPSTNPLKATTSIKKSSSSEYVNGDDNGIYLENNTDTFNYKFTLSNESNGIVRKDNFYYYIPVAGNLDTLPEAMRGTLNNDASFDLKLTGEPTITGDTGYYTVKYSINATSTNYNNGTYTYDTSDGTYATYYTADEIEEMDAWDSVSMIKITANQSIDYIPPDSITNFIFNMTYKGSASDFVSDAGKSNIFKSIGIQNSYDSSNTLVANTTGTNAVNVTIKYTNTYNFTLTGADGEPTNGSRSYTFNFPTISSTQDFKVLEYSVNNFELKDYETIKYYKSSNLPSAYQEVNYIESASGAYIDTGLAPSTTQKWQLVVQDMTSRAAYNYMGAGYSSNGRVSILSFYSSNKIGTVITGITNVNPINFDNTAHNLELDLLNKTFTADGNTVNLTGDYNAFTSDNITLFGDGYYAGSKRIYSAKIYDNNTLVRNFVPCYRISDNKVGMYDTVNDVFYTGSGTFIKGDDVESITSGAADNYFGIMLNHNGINYDLNSGLGTIDSVNANEENEVTVTLANYANIMDVTRPKSLTIKLGNEEGIELTLNININRERSNSSVHTSYIDNGKIYNLTNTNQDSITMKKNGSFTSQFIIEGITASDYNSHSLVFNSSLPEGTKMLLIDETGSNPVYYKYDLTSSLSQIDLSSFTSLEDGTSFTDNVYNNERFILIVDFSNTNEELEASTYNMIFRVFGTEGNPNYDINQSFTVEASRTFTQSNNSITGSINTGLTIGGKITTVADTYMDSYYYQRKMALKVSIIDSNNNVVDMPLGAIIKVGDNTYYAEDKYIIVPLDDIGTTTYSYILKTPLEKLESGSYNVKTELYVYDTSNPNDPLGGYLVTSSSQSFTVEEELDYALKISTENDNHLYTKSELSSLDIHLDYNENTADNPIKIEILKKINGIYLLQTDLLTSARINNTNYTASSGIVLYPSNTYKENGIDIVLNTASNLFVEKGTYRIKVSIAEMTGKNTETYYNIIVKDDETASRASNNGMPEKGDIITMNVGSGLPTSYRVMKIDGTKALVMSMSDYNVGTTYAYNTTSTTTTFSDGSSGQKYEGSTIDTLLDTTMHNSLNDVAKSAIVSQNIKQYKYSSVSGSATSGTQGVDYWQSTRGFGVNLIDTPNYYLSKVGNGDSTAYVNVGKRNIYVLDVKDVLDYFDNETFTDSELNTLFFNQNTIYSSNSTVGNQYLWLRSSYSNIALFVLGNNGYIDANEPTNEYGVRPAFTINLSKIDFSINE